MVISSVASKAHGLTNSRALAGRVSSVLFFESNCSPFLSAISGSRGGPAGVPRGDVVEQPPFRATTSEAGASSALFGERRDRVSLVSDSIYLK